MVSVLLPACDLDVGPDRVFIDSPITLDVLEGQGSSDTVQARVPIRLQLVPEDDEVPRPLRLDVFFSVPGEDCGEPERSQVPSDAVDQVANSWILGTLAQECVMDVMVVAPGGTSLGSVRIDGTIEPGRAVDGWLPPGTVARGADTLVMGAGTYPLEDRFGNLQDWRFQVVSGPVVVLGEALDDDRSRTLVATGEGSGEVDILSRFGAYLRAGFNVCTSEERKWIRVFRPEDAATVLAACP